MPARAAKGQVQGVWRLSLRAQAMGEALPEMSGRALDSSALICLTSDGMHPSRKLRPGPLLDLSQRPWGFDRSNKAENERKRREGGEPVEETHVDLAGQWKSPHAKVPRGASCEQETGICFVTL